MRVGEITGLRWCDVDFKKGLIDVNHTLVYYAKDRQGSSFAINDTKTPASKRLIPMTEGLKEALRLEKEMQDILGVSCDVEINGYTDFVFLNRFGGLQHQGTLNRVYKRIIRDFVNLGQTLRQFRAFLGTRILLRQWISIRM